jgi:hypothetical protein
MDEAQNTIRSVHQRVEAEPEAEPPSDAACPQEGAQRPWWHRVFGV